MKGNKSMKLTTKELQALFASVARDANKRIDIRNFSQACCGGYCSGTCCTSNTAKPVS